MDENLKSDLNRHLAGVSAPDELWERVCERRAPRRREFYVPLWAAAVVLFSLGGGSFAAWRGVPREPQVKPAIEYQSRAMQKTERCTACHAI